MCYNVILEDWVSNRFEGINLEWNYTKAHKNTTCHFSTKSYITDLLLRLGHTTSATFMLSPHKSKAIKYGFSVQLSPEEDMSYRLDKDGITRV